MTQELLKLAGSFWAEINDDPAVRNLLEIQTLLQTQNARDTKLLHDCIARSTTPLFRTIVVQPLLLRWSEQLVQSNGISWSLPAGLVAIPAIADKLIEPSKIWLNNIDYTISYGSICFNTSPFESEGQLTYGYLADGTVYDSNITIWAFEAQYDERYLENLWGAVFGLKSASCEEYRQLLNIVYDAAIHGTKRAHIEQALVLLHGTTLAKDHETVLFVTEDEKGSFVATDKNIYRAQGSETAVVKAGDSLKPGNPIFDTCSYGDNRTRKRNEITYSVKHSVPNNLHEIDRARLLHLLVPPHISLREDKA